MSEKRFRVIHKQRYDTLENWTTKNPLLMEGEIAFSVYASTTDEGTVQQTYCKVGDGEHNYNDLPFLTARAGDVYSWAKSETKPTYKAEEIEGLEDYINSLELEDSNTIYRIVQGEDDKTFIFQSQEKGETTWTDAFTLHIPDDITYEISSDSAGQLTLTPSKGDPTTVTVVEIDSTKEDITSTSIKLPTSGAVADYVEDAINAASSRIMRFKGFKQTFDDLPTADNTIGDVWSIKETGEEWCWTEADDGTQYWEYLGALMDMSKFATKDDLDTKQDLIDENNKLSSAFIDGTATDTQDGLMSKEDKAKLDALNEDAQENVIERIIAGDQELPVIDKAVTLAKIAETGNVMDLQQDDDNVLILDGGNCLGFLLEPTTYILNGGTSGSFAAGGA